MPSGHPALTANQEGGIEGNFMLYTITNNSRNPVVIVTTRGRQVSIAAGAKKTDVDLDTNTVSTLRRWAQAGSKLIITSQNVPEPLPIADEGARGPLGPGPDPVGPPGLPGPVSLRGDSDILGPTTAPDEPELEQSEEEQQLPRIPLKKKRVTRRVRKVKGE